MHILQGITNIFSLTIYASPVCLRISPLTYAEICHSFHSSTLLFLLLLTFDAWQVYRQIYQQTVNGRVWKSTRRDEKIETNTDEKLHKWMTLGSLEFSPGSSRQRQRGRERAGDDEPPFMFSSSSFRLSSHCKCGHIVGVLGNLFSKAAGEIESFQSQLRLCRDYKYATYISDLNKYYLYI